MEKKKRLEVQDFIDKNSDEITKEFNNNQFNNNYNFKNENSMYKPQNFQNSNRNNQRFDNNSNNYYNKQFNNYNKGNTYNRRDENNEGRRYDNRGNFRGNKQQNSHFSNYFSSGSSGNYFRTSNNSYKNADLTEIKYDISKVFQNIEDNILKEIILHKKMTLEEIVNFLCLSTENQKSEDQNKNDNNKKHLSSNKYCFENEKKDHREYILNYKVNSNEIDSRRPLKVDNNFFFNYIPVKCKKDHSNDEADEKDSCIFSHNQNEINYHFLKFKIFLCHDKECSWIDCPNAHGSADLRNMSTLFVFLKNKNKRDFVMLKRKILESRFFKDIIVSHYDNQLPIEFDLNTYKVFKCPLGENCSVDYHLCFNYHELKERRRDPNLFKVEKNEYCQSVRSEGKLLEPSLCPNGDFCEFFHTRNEINYDYRNYRRITDCLRNNRRPCEFFDVCYGKHYDEKGKLLDSKTDKNLEEMKILQNDKEELLKDLQKKNQKLNNLSNEVKEIEGKISAVKCNNPNCSKEFVLVLRVLSCKHYYCETCFQEILSSKTCYKCMKKNEKMDEKTGHYQFYIDKLDNSINRSK